MEIVESPIVPEKKEYGDAASHGNGQPENIDEGNGFVRQKMPPCETEISGNHIVVPQSLLKRNA
jgi:hypothetical protein